MGVGVPGSFLWGSFMDAEGRLVTLPETVAPIADIRKTRRELFRLDAVFDALIGREGRHGGGAGGGLGLRLPARDGRVPSAFVPLAVRRVVAADGVEGFRHDSRGGVVVGPDAAVDELTGDDEVVGPLEDLGREADHAAGEAGEVLCLRFGDDVVHHVDAGAAGEEDVMVVLR